VTDFKSPGAESHVGRKENLATRRIPVLDGWRAISILLVLGAHLLPLGPAAFQLNWTAGAAGMALFFTLSGFLIVQFLAGGAPLGEFVAKRLARIVPLAWSAMIILSLWHHYAPTVIARNFLFVANLPPASFMIGGNHLWSLCVEMQFYTAVAAVCMLFGRRGLYLVPLSAIAVTCARISAGQKISIVTWHRIDEILAGGTLALVHAGWLGQASKRALDRLPLLPCALVLAIASHPATGVVQYVRPYAAAALVGASLNHGPARLTRFLSSRPMRYIAEISYALYVVHGVLADTWLGTGTRVVKYLKRPLLFAATFGIAHVSTRYFERPINRAVREFVAGSRRTVGGPSGA
jgi:peptidoglycan/LPS O-acetylase OafA/YrhL